MLNMHTKLQATGDFQAGKCFWGVFIGFWVVFGLVIRIVIQGMVAKIAIADQDPKENLQLKVSDRDTARNGGKAVPKDIPVT